MALIKCPDCNKEVSSNAPTCPGCGAPIAHKHDAQAAGVTLVTTQETSKKFKAHIVIASILFWSGAMFLWAAVESGHSELGGASLWETLSALAMGVGLLWYIVSRFRIWWHHK